MVKKNWVEFDNQENSYQQKPREENLRKITKIRPLQ